MEYIDILDSQGKITGKTKPKSEVHRDGDLHKAVHVWIINSKGELLVQRRSPEKESHPNMWDISSAGHVSAGEDAITSAMRETEEELGLFLKRENFEYLFTHEEHSVLNNGTYINNEFDDVYLVTMDIDPTKLKLQTEEVAEVKFIPYQQLVDMVAERDPSLVSHPEEYRRLFEELRKRYG